MENLSFTTRVLHTKYPKQDVHGALRMPVYDNAAFEFQTAEEIELAFIGKKPGHAYSRISNPTVEYLEQVIKEVTGSFAVLAVSTGMAAISNTILSVAGNGDNIITTRKLFGNTYSLFANTLSDLGLEFRFVDLNNDNEIESQVDNNTRAIFFETITNPQIEVADVGKLVNIAHKHNLLVIADTTLTPPYIFNSKLFGVDIEVISSTKYISGGATSLGGIIIDNGIYNWQQNPKTNSFYQQVGPFAFLYKLKKEVFRNMGATLSAHNAYLQTLGLETFTLRVDKSCQNTIELAYWLENQSKVISVNYPGLESSPFYLLSKKQFGDKPGSVFTFDLDSKQACFRFINNVKLARRATNLNDNKTLIIHPASTIFCEYAPNVQLQLGIKDTTIRIATGIEDIEDLINDIDQSLKKI